MSGARRRIVLTLIHINAANGKQVDEILEDEIVAQRKPRCRGHCRIYWREGGELSQPRFRGNERASHRTLERARELDAEMLVMGASRHSKISELVLGGATRAVLRWAELPVLLSQ